MLVYPAVGKTVNVPAAMKIVKEMDPETVLKALEGHENVLGPAAQAQQEYFKKLQCYRCGTDVAPVVNERQLFKPNEILPNVLARCKGCGVVFEPYTKIEVSLPESYPDYDPYDPESI